MRPWILVVVVSAGVGLWLGHDILTPKAGIRVPREAAPIHRLPANVRNVINYLRPPASYHEFDTDEAGFEEWVAMWRRAWKDRGEGPRTVISGDHTAGKPGELQVQDWVEHGWWSESRRIRKKARKSLQNLA